MTFHNHAFKECIPLIILAWSGHYRSNSSIKEYINDPLCVFGHGAGPAYVKGYIY